MAPDGCAKADLGQRSTLSQNGYGERNGQFRYRRVEAWAVNAELERSVGSAVPQYREMVDFDVDRSRRGLSMHSWRGLSVPSRPNIEEMVDFDIDGSRRGPSMQSWRDLSVPS